MKNKLLSIFLVIIMFMSVAPMGDIGIEVSAASNLKICGVDIGMATNTFMQFTTADGTNSNSGYYYKGKYLGASQCFGFARWCQFKLFGTISLGNRDEEYIENSNKDFYWVSANGFSSVAAGNLTVSKLKALINAAKPGAHIRTNGSQHSMIITDITSDGFSIAQCNGSNNNEYSGYKQNYIGTYTYTWSSYVSSTYGSRGIAYIEMPYKYSYDSKPTISGAKGTSISEITVNWSKIETATKYQVERRKSGTSDYVVAKNSTTSTTFTDSGLETGQRYFYRVTAYNGSTKLGTSESVGVYTKFASPVIKAVSDSKLKITWDSVSKAENYTIMRRKSGDDAYKEIKTVTDTSYTDSGLSASTQYYYWIKANCNVDGTEIVAKSTSAGQYTFTKAPAIKNVNDISKSELEITWNDVSGAESYRITRRKSGDSEYKTLKSGLTTTSYKDTGLETGQRYYYIVYATNSAGESAASTSVGGYTKFNAPVVTTVNSSQLNLSWDSVSKAESYTIKRRTYNGEYENVKTVTGTNYTDSGLQSGTQYYYWIQANCKVDGTSIVAKSESKGQYTQLTVPKVTVINSTSLKISWDTIKGADTYKYIVQRKLSSENNYQTISTITGNSYTDNDLSPSTTYNYRIQVLNSDGKTCSTTDKIDGKTAACSHNYTSTVTTVATCKSEGVKTFTCSKCNDSYTKSINATGHNWTAATCTSKKTCSTCSATEGTALGHNYTLKVTKAATCTTTGTKTFTCSKCSASYNDTIPATGHKWSNATCAAKKTCSTCGTTEGNALGHSYTSKVTTAATCTANGTKTFTCSKCSDSYTENILATGHSWKNTTCTEKKTCLTCGATEGKALGHSYTSKVTKDATCTANGTKTYTCSKCTDSYTENIPTTGHSWKNATCTEKKTCLTCGITEGNTLGHSYTSKVTTAATCTANGTKTFTCSKCSDSYTENILATGHDHVADVTEPTCTKSGYTTYICICGDSYTADETDATGHIPGEWEVVTPAKVRVEGLEIQKCSVCGEKLEEKIIPALEKPAAPEYIPGDVNGDGKITAADARVVLRASAKLETLDENVILAADVNKDDKITAADARIILRVSAKLETLE